MLYQGAVQRGVSAETGLRSVKSLVFNSELGVEVERGLSKCLLAYQLNAAFGNSKSLQNPEGNV